MRRRAYFSLTGCFDDFKLDQLSLYVTDRAKSNGTMWAASPHHLLFTSFCFPFQLEKAGVQRAMGVDLDDIFTAAATILFYIPVLRDLVITLGGRIASPKVLSAMKVFAVAPGGIHEMIRQSPNIDRVFLRTGFLRFALQKKLDINVIYLFDENECFRPMSGLHPLVVRAQRFMHRQFGIGIPLWKGRWGVPFNLLPYPVEYVAGVGRPIMIKDVESMDTDAAIEFLLEAYTNELQRLFAELKTVTGRRQNSTIEIIRLETRKARTIQTKGKKD